MRGVSSCMAPDCPPGQCQYQAMWYILRHNTTCFKVIPRDLAFCYRCLEQLLGDQDLPRDSSAEVTAMLLCASGGPSQTPLFRAFITALGGEPSTISSKAVPARENGGGSGALVKRKEGVALACEGCGEAEPADSMLLCDG